jgi:hypothetical protein
MKRLAVLVTCTVALRVAGAASAAPRDARLIGLLRLCGGPPPGRCSDDNGNNIFLINSHRHVVASQRAHHGRFSFLVVPGSYTISINFGGFNVRRSVTLAAHQTRHVDITVAVP